MQKIGSITSTADSAGEFTDGNVAGGVSPTILPAAFFNTLQRELVNIVTSAGITLDPNTDTQVLTALQQLLLSRKNPFADIKADGTVATGLANLGLGGFVQDIGAANAVVIASPVTLADGVPFLVKFAAVNTGATTIKIGSAAAIPLLGVAGALQGGEIAAGGYGWIAYSSTLASAILLSPAYGGALQVAPATKSEHAVQLGQFSALRSGTGYRKLPDGTIKMWGIAITASLASGSQAGWSVSLPTAFPNYMLCASACIANGALSNGSTTSIMDVGTPFTGTADTVLPKAAATTISGVAINASGMTTKLLIRWECEGY